MPTDQGGEERFREKVPVRVPGSSEPSGTKRVAWPEMKSDSRTPEKLIEPSSGSPGR